MNEAALLRTLADRGGSVTERTAAAAALGTLAGASYAVWQVLCGVFQDARDQAEVRMAAAQAIGQRNPAGAPNQLCRFLEGDDDRRVRREAVAVLSQLGRVSDSQEPRLRRDLETLRTSMSLTPLLNLASSYGRDPRVLAMLREALRHADPEIREIALRGLGSVGEMTAVVEVLRDESPLVRAGAAETLGYYGLLTPDEITGLEDALRDADSSVRRAALVAQRRLGLRPSPAPPTQPPSKRASEGARVASPASAPGAPHHDWLPFLEHWSRQWLHVRAYSVELPDEVTASGWLGFPGASEQEVQLLEQRLGRSLPPSYRTFLQVSNGWRRTSPFIEKLWSTSHVACFRVHNQEWVNVWTGAPVGVSDEQHRQYGAHQDVTTFRAEYLLDAVQISDVGDAAAYLLNPAVVTSEGEWEAWFLASWLPGAQRYRSFWDLMHAEYATFVRLEKPSE